MSDLKGLQRRLEKAADPKSRHPVLEDIAEYYYNKSDFKHSLEFYKRMLQAATELDDPKKIAKAHRMIGEVKVELGHYDDALKHIRVYYDFASTNNSRDEEQRALTTLGRTYLIKAESMPDKDSKECIRTYEIALKFLFKSLQVCDKLQEEKTVTESEIYDMKARSLLNIGDAYEGMNNAQEAEDNFKLAIRSCRSGKLSGALARQCYLNLANLCFRQGRFDESLKLYMDAIEAVKSLPDKERKEAVTETLKARSQAHIFKGDIHSARKDLLKAYRMKLKSDIASDVSSRLRLVAGIDLALRKVDEIPDTFAEEKSKKYEEIGDGFSQLKAYSQALENYQMMLQYCKAAGYNLKNCYVSLAQTAMDLKKYEEAISYFEEEITFCSPQEACNSLTSIQECQKASGATIYEQIQTLEKALEKAEEAKDDKLKRQTLQKLHRLQEVAGCHQDSEKSRAKLESFGESLSDCEEEEEECVEVTSKVGDDLDLDALSDSSMDENDEEADSNGMLGLLSSSKRTRPKRNINRTRQASMRKNEKGETKLHVACIRGKISAVRTLLELGCHVNATDYAGWTPLHEACNNDNKDIVELLLNHGANIDQRGGLDGIGITPLQDAASAGNFEIIEYLLERNASVDLKDSKGRTVLDYLENYYELEGYNFTIEERHQYNRVRDKLQTLLCKGVNKNKNDTRISPLCIETKRAVMSECTGNLRRAVDVDYPSPRKRSIRDISPLSSPESNSSPVRNQSKVDKGEGGVSEYVKTMQILRKNCRASRSPEPHKKNLESLIPENEVVEDWLEDDMGMQPSKKRRRSDPIRSNVGSSYQPLSVKRKSVSRLSLNSHSPTCVSPCSSDFREETRFSTGSGNSEKIDTSAACLEWETDQHFERSRNQPPDEFWHDSPNSNASEPIFSLPEFCQSPLSLFGITRQVNNKSQTLPSSQQSVRNVSTIPNRVNVKVEDRLLAIPIADPSLSIGWLAKEAAKRYKVDGCQPILSICSSDGAMYSSEDLVSSVIGTDIVGHIETWDVPPIIDRYKEACQSLRTDIEDSLVSPLEETQETKVLEITDKVFKMQILKPVFRAISMERNLYKINLSNNVLSDEGVKDLCHHLGKLCNLKELDLSGNNISEMGMQELAKAAKKGHLKELCDLNLSYNHLGDASVQLLIEITESISALKSLSVADCMFTRSVWNNSNQFLTLNKLQSLDLSYNKLHTNGLAWFLGFTDPDEKRRLSPSTLQFLHLVGLEGENLCRELLLFLEQDRSIALRELHLSYSSMKDEDLSQLTSVLQNAPELHTLRLPAAVHVRLDTVCKLLVCQPALKCLEIHNNKNMWDGSDKRSDIAAAVKHAANASLVSFTVKHAPYVVEEAWKAVKGQWASVKKGAGGLQKFSENGVHLS